MRAGKRNTILVYYTTSPKRGIVGGITNLHGRETATRPRNHRIISQLRPRIKHRTLDPWLVQSTTWKLKGMSYPGWGEQNLPVYHGCRVVVVVSGTCDHSICSSSIRFDSLDILSICMTSLPLETTSLCKLRSLQQSRKFVHRFKVPS